MCDVLLLDDDGLILLCLAEMLREEGFEVAEARCAADAMPLLSGDPPRVLVTDIDLRSGGNGLQVARQARRATPHLPVIFMTGTPGAVPRTEHDGGTCVLAKPFRPSELVCAIRELTAH